MTTVIRSAGLVPQKIFTVDTVNYEKEADRLLSSPISSYSLVRPNETTVVLIHKHSYPKRLEVMA